MTLLDCIGNHSIVVLEKLHRVRETYTIQMTVGNLGVLKSGLNCRKNPGNYIGGFIRNKMSGYVYLIGTSTFGWYKIGKSITPEIRIKDLGILLPFKLQIFGVWYAENHHLMEKALHEMYKTSRINGEWFEFTKQEVYQVFNNIPTETRIYPTDNNSNSFDRFSNIETDTKKSSRVLGVKVQKLRGNFTSEERDAIRDCSIQHQTMRKQLRKIKGYSNRSETFAIVCNNPYRDKKVKLNIFTALF